MIADINFWEKEKDAPILNRNNNYFNYESSNELLQRAQQLLLLLEERHGNKNIIKEINLLPNCHDEAANRIFRLDAERTFKSEECRQQLVEVLSSLWPELLDYHQGLGFIVSFLLLLLPSREVIRICLYLDRIYLHGYFKGAPINYVRDARVLEMLLREKDNKLYKHIKEYACAEAYVSKWFIGLNIHILTYKSLLLFIEKLIIIGNIYLFKYALSLFIHTQLDLMHAYNTCYILEILRLDNNYLFNKFNHNQELQEQFLLQIVQDAEHIHLDPDHIEELRAIALQELKEEEERRRQRDIELGLDSDDSIVFSDEEEEEEEEKEEEKKKEEKEEKKEEKEKEEEKEEKEEEETKTTENNEEKSKQIKETKQSPIDKRECDD